MVAISEFLAEASVLISPDLVAFRAKLLAELEAATRVIPPVTVPLVPSATTATPAAVTAAARATQAAAFRQQQLNVAETAAIGIVDRHAKSVGNLTRGVGIQALSFAGLRGAVLNANPAFIAGAAAALTFGAALRTAANLESELSVFRVTAGATADEMERVAATAKDLGADLTLPAVSAGDAAQAMTELAKAGLSVNDSIAGARGVLQLATAAQISNAEATELAANALNAYGLAGDQAVHVADVLANAANSAQGSISDFGQALAQSSAVARQVGLSLEDTTAILTLFARNGLRGSDAGTALRTSMIRLIAPTEKAQGIIDDLGLKIRDLNGNVRPDIFAQFGRATADLSPAVRDAAAAMIFGQDAIRAVAIGAREGTAGLRSAQNDIAQTGTAAELAAARMEGLTGAARGLGSNLQTLGVTVGTVALPAMTGLTRASTGLVSGLNAGLGAIGNFTTGLVSLTNQAAESSPVFQRLGDIFDVLNRVEFSADLGDAGFGLRDNDVQSLQEAVDAFKEIGLSADEQRSKIGDVFGPLIAQAKEVRSALAGEGLSTAAVDKVIADLSAKLDALRQGVAFDPAAEALSPLELSLIRTKNLIESFRGLGLPTDALERDARQIQASLDALVRTRPARESGGIAPVLQTDLRRAKELLQQAQTDAEHLDPTDPLAPAARKGIQAVIAELKKLGPAGATALAEAGKLLTGSFKVNVTDGLIAAAELGVSQAVVAGTNTTTTAALRGLEAAQQAAVERAEFLFRASGGVDAAQGGKPLATRRAQELKDRVDDLNNTRAQIQGIQDRVVADAEADRRAAEQRRNDAIEARNRADRAVLDSFSRGQSRIDLAAVDARASQGLQDDIRLQVLIANTASREIETIDRTVKDTQTRNAAIAERVRILKAAAAELDRLRKEVADAATQRRRDAADALTESLAKEITLAGLRENEGAELAAINKAIANARNRIKNYKKLGLNLQDEQIALEQLINQRDEINKIKAQGDGGTTAFELLKQAAETFTANAGNLVNANQPFAGPTGFTADMAQFLRRQQGTPRVPLQINNLEDTRVEGTNRLIAALERLTDATLTAAGGNSSTATKLPVSTSIARNDKRFYESRVTRSQVDADTGGGI